ncbi:MAG: leucine-rich repeat domain-containing protein [Bacteroidota bacterium]
MGNVSEAQSRIEQAKESGSKELNLQGLGLKQEDLKQLLPAINKIEGLRTLNLSQNKLTELPSEIKELPKLTRLDLSANQLTKLPITTTFKLKRTVDSLDLSKNPLSLDTMNSLQSARESGQVQMDMDKKDTMLLELYREGHTTVKERLETLYGDEAESKMNALASLDPGSFINEEGGEMTAQKVVADLLEKVPFDPTKSAQTYQQAAKDLLDNALSPNLRDEEKKETLQIMAISLGNCPTPVKKFLLQSHIGKHPDDKELLPLIASLAIEENIVKKLSGQLAKDERIEQVQGLVNSLFLEGAETNDHNKIPIAGERDRLPSTTQYVDYAFKKVTEPLVTAFAEMCCKTDDQGQLIKEGNNYQLDQSKVNAIVEPYKAGLGIVNEREKLLTRYDSEIQEHILDNDLIEHYEHEEVSAAIDTRSQKDELRRQLSNTSDSEVQAVFDDYLTQQKETLTRLGDKYNEPTSSETQHTNPLAAMTVALNSDKKSKEAPKRSESPTSVISLQQPKAKSVKI